MTGTLTAVDVDIAVTGFTAFQPASIGAGAYPTSITFSLHNYGPGSIGTIFGGTGPVLLDLWISVNATFGDPDDLWLGQMQSSISLPAGAESTITLSNPNGLSGFTIPSAANGTYQVFLRVSHTPSSGRTDPDPSDNTRALSTTISVGSDLTAPTVISINRLSPSGQLTSAPSVTWRVTFSEHVNGVSTPDFTLVDVSNTITNDSLVSVSASSGNTFDVTANTGSNGNGDLRLDVLSSVATITDDAGNRFNSSFRNGQVYSIDKTPPSVLQLVGVISSLRTSAVTNVDVVFSESINLSTFSYQDIALTQDGRPVPLTSTVTVNALSGATYRINNLDSFTSAVGEYTLMVSASGVQDLAGNAGAGSASASWTNAHPSISIAISTNNLFISWPAWADGYELEQATNLSAPMSWLAVPAVPVVDGERKTITLNNPGTNGFFRLKR